MEVPGRRDPWRVPFRCVHLVERDGLRFHSANGVDTILSRGDTFLIEPDVAFCYHETDSRPMRLWALRLEGPLAPSFVEAMGFRSGRLHFPVADPARLARIFRSLRKLAERDDPEIPHQIVSTLHQLPPAFDPSPRDPEEGDDLARRLLQHLRLNLALGENVEALARRFGVSRHTLFLHCRRQFDCSPAQLLIDTRIARARTLLETTSFTNSEIAGLCGYSSVEHFHRQFRERVDMSPKDWKEAGRSSD